MPDEMIKFKLSDIFVDGYDKTTESLKEIDSGATAKVYNLDNKAVKDAFKKYVYKEFNICNGCEHNHLNELYSRYRNQSADLLNYLAFPIVEIVDEKDNCKGFLMHRANGVDLSKFYEKNDIDLERLKDIVVKFEEIIDVIHNEINLLLGDLISSNNILISDDNGQLAPFFIDVDSICFSGDGIQVKDSPGYIITGEEANHRTQKTDILKYCWTVLRLFSKMDPSYEKVELYLINRCGSPEDRERKNRVAERGLSVIETVFGKAYRDAIVDGMSENADERPTIEEIIKARTDKIYLSQKEKTDKNYDMLVDKPSKNLCTSEKETTKTLPQTGEFHNKTDGDLSNKLRANDPCPCSSGKKYIKCCGENKSRATNFRLVNTSMSIKQIGESGECTLAIGIRPGNRYRVTIKHTDLDYIKNRILIPKTIRIEKHNYTMLSATWANSDKAVDGLNKIKLKNTVYQKLFLTVERSNFDTKGECWYELKSQTTFTYCISSIRGFIKKHRIVFYVALFLISLLGGMLWYSRDKQVAESSGALDRLESKLEEHYVEEHSTAKESYNVLDRLESRLEEHYIEKHQTSKDPSDIFDEFGSKTE